MFGVLGILLFGDVAGDPVERDFGIAAIVMMNSGLFVGAIADLRDHGGDGHHSHRQEIAADEVVQEAAFAGLEPAQYGDADFVLARRRTDAGEQAGERGNLVPRRDFGGQVESRWAGLRGVGDAVGFGDILRPQNHSSSRVGAIIPETASRQLMAGSITSGLNQIIACFRGGYSGSGGGAGGARLPFFPR